MGTTGRYPSLVLGIQHDAINAGQRPGWLARLFAVGPT
jgi:hypothetical protein